MKKIIALLLLAAGPAFGHARLESSSPAKDAKVKSPHMITLKFAEALEPAFSGAALSDVGGKAIPVPSGVNGNAMTLLPGALKPGVYTVTWHSVGHDTHRLTGSFSFTVVP